MFRLLLFTFAIFLLSSCGSESSGPDQAGNNPANQSKGNNQSGTKCHFSAETKLSPTITSNSEGSWLSRYVIIDGSYEWMPILLTNSEFSNSTKHRLSQNGLSPDCSSIAETFGKSYGMDDQGEVFFIEKSITHYINFDFPSEIREVPDSPTPVTMESKIAIQFTSGPTLEEQEIPVEVSCAKPFTVEPHWFEKDENEPFTKFCRIGVGDVEKSECLGFVAKHNESVCEFSSQKPVRLKTADGKEFVLKKVTGTFHDGENSDRLIFKSVEY